MLVQDLLPLYIEGEVSSGSRHFIVEHLGQCQRCAGFLAGAQSVRAQFRREHEQRAAAVEQEQARRGDVPEGLVNFVPLIAGAVGLSVVVAIIVLSVFQMMAGSVNLVETLVADGARLAWVAVGLLAVGAVTGVILRRESLSPVLRAIICGGAVVVGVLVLAAPDDVAIYRVLATLLIGAGLIGLWQVSSAPQPRRGNVAKIVLASLLVGLGLLSLVNTLLRPVPAANEVVEAFPSIVPVAITSTPVMQPTVPPNEGMMPAVGVTTPSPAPHAQAEAAPLWTATPVR
jgi:predicted anti-sigma-YlaC factor YlaD